MKILIISQRFYPEDFRINDISVSLKKRGHQVTVLTGLPNYPTGIIPPEYRKRNKRTQLIDGVKVIRTWEIGRKKGVIGLACNYFSLALSSSFYALFSQQPYDLIYVYQTSPVFSLLPAWIIKKRFKIPIFLYCCDLWPESLKAYGIKERNILFRFMKHFSGWLYKQSDCIAVTSLPFMDYLNQVHHINSIQMCYMPQHAESLYLTMDLVSEKNDTVHFLFTGNIGKVQDIPCIIRAATRISPTLDFLIHIVGDGSALEECKEMVQKLQIQERFIFHGRYPVTEMPKFYKIADACLLTLTGDSLIGMTIPSKLQGYMAAGKPVIASINGASRKIIEASKCGVCVNAGDDLALSKAMEDFIINRSNYEECGKNGRNYFQDNFTLDIFMDNLTKMLMNLKED